MPRYRRPLIVARGGRGRGEGGGGEHNPGIAGSRRSAVPAGVVPRPPPRRSRAFRQKGRGGATRSRHPTPRFRRKAITDSDGDDDDDDDDEDEGDGDGALSEENLRR